MVLTFIIIVIVVKNFSYEFSVALYTFYLFSNIANEWKFTWVVAMC